MYIQENTLVAQRITTQLLSKMKEDAYKIKIQRSTKILVTSNLLAKKIWQNSASQ